MAQPPTAQLEERVDRLRALLEDEPDDAMSWFGLGRALLELDRANEAIVPFRRATAVDPSYTAAHRDLGRALLDCGQALAAREALQAAADLADHTGDLQTGNEARVFLRRAQRALGESAPEPAADDAPKARRSLAESASAGRSPAHPLYKEGFEHFANDRLAPAIEVFQRAIEVDPDFAIAWNGLSLAYRQKGQLDAAIEAGKRLIELEPDDPLSHTNLSILYQRCGMIPEAEDEKAIAMQLQMRAQGRSER